MGETEQEKQQQNVIFSKPYFCSYYMPVNFTFKGLDDPGDSSWLLFPLRKDDDESVRRKPEDHRHGLINYKDTKAQFTCNGTLRKVFIYLTPRPLL